VRKTLSSKPKPAPAPPAPAPAPPAPAEPAPAADAAMDEAGDAAGEDDEGAGVAPNSGNGADHGAYSWTQTLGDVTVCVPVPPGTKGSGVSVRITKSRFSVGLKGAAAVLDGELHEPVAVDDCMWSVVDGRTIEVTLQKLSGMCWWPRVVRGEPEIDTKKVEPENSKLSDLDPETRATVEKMMFDQRQKQMNQPTSDEMQRQQALEKFMAAHPEMDFSQAKIM